jgi:PAT family beta-lactamase induction signal transducer AmpG
MLVPLLMRERPGEKMLPWTKGTASESAAHMQLHSWSQIFRSLFKVFFLPSSFLMGVAIFCIEIGIGLMDAILPVFTIQEVGWTDARFSHIFSITNIVAGILGMVAGGALSDLFGKKRMMTFYLAASIALVIIMAFIKNSWGDPYVITGFIGIYYTLYVFLTIAIFATGMQLCWNRISATQFTLYMAIANMGRAVGAWHLGPLKENLPWEYVILSYAIFALAMLLIIQFLRMRRHQLRVEVLEKNHLDTHAPALPLP